MDKDVWGPVIEHLSRPWDDDQLKFKIQSMADDRESWAIAVAYVDARDVERRLNELIAFGVLWENDFYIEPPKEDGGEWHATYTIVLSDGETTVSRSDVGMGKDPKAAVSDGLKRTAVLFGMDDAYSGERIRLRQGEFTKRGKIKLPREKLLYLFRNGSQREQSPDDDAPTEESAAPAKRNSRSGDSGDKSKPTEKQLNLLKKLLNEVKKKGCDPKEFVAFVNDGEMLDIRNASRREISNLLDAMLKDFDAQVSDFCSDAPTEGEEPEDDDLPW